jgi:uncharacterized protein with HEPN domain
MPRNVLAYLSDISGACEAIGRFLSGVDYAAYREAELTRSGVERQLILIGEAVNSLLRLEPELAGRISRARRIVDFRNQLAHDYAAVNHAVVWAIATDEAPVLRAECEALLAERSGGSEAD